MSFLECVGHLMAATGLTQVLEVVYAENAVKHILSGKAISRAIRGHLMVHAALSTMLVAKTYNIPLSLKWRDEDVLHPRLVNARELYDDVMAGASATAILPSEDVLCDIMDKVNFEKETLKEMIGILPMFIKAERIGDWNSHLQAVHKMLPYFAAVGHNLYTKSTYIYLQKLQQLSESHPDIYTSFLNGYHVIW